MLHKCSRRLYTESLSLSHDIGHKTDVVGQGPLSRLSVCETYLFLFRHRYCFPVYHWFQHFFRNFWVYRRLSMTSVIVSELLDLIDDTLVQFIILRNYFLAPFRPVQSTIQSLDIETNIVGSGVSERTSRVSSHFQGGYTGGYLC